MMATGKCLQQIFAALCFNLLDENFKALQRNGQNVASLNSLLIQTLA